MRSAASFERELLGRHEMLKNERRNVERGRSQGPTFLALTRQGPLSLLVKRKKIIAKRISRLVPLSKKRHPHPHLRSTTSSTDSTRLHLVILTRSMVALHSPMKETQSGLYQPPGQPPRLLPLNPLRLNLQSSLDLLLKYQQLNRQQLDPLLCLVQLQRQPDPSFL